MAFKFARFGTPTTEYAVVDVETTGFGTGDRIVEVAIVVIDEHGTEITRWETLVQPDRDIPNAGIHGIDATMVVDAPRFTEIAGDVAELLSGRVLVAHNASFDTRFLQQELNRTGVLLVAEPDQVLDTLSLAKNLLPGSPRRLDACLQAVGIENVLAHSALGDAAATAALLAQLSTVAGGLPRRRPVDIVDAPEPSGKVVTREGSRGVNQRGQWLQRITAALPGDAADTDNYRRLLRAALVDNHLSATEIGQLVAAAEEDGLDRDDVAEIHRQYLRQLAVAAWADGVVDDAEREELLTVAHQLGVERAEIEDLLTAPVATTDEALARFALHTGDRVAFTGQLTLPRDEWEDRVRQRGLVVGGLARATVVLVAANPDSMSGKARRARELGVPIIDEATFASLVRQLAEESPTPESDPALTTVTIVQTPEPEAAAPVASAAILPWLSEKELELLNTAERFAAEWNNRFADRQLADISPVLDPAVLPDAAPETSVIGKRWLEEYARPLEASAADVLSLRGVGRVKLRRILESLLQEALDAGESTEMEEEEFDEDLLAREDLTTAQSELVAKLLEKEWHAVIQEDWRYSEIISKRLLGGATLQEIGDEFAVSRERVRQLESALQRELDNALPISTSVATWAGEHFSPLMALDTVEQQWSFLRKPAIFPRHRWCEVIELLQPSWTVQDGFLTQVGFEEKVISTVTALADDYGPVPIKLLAAELDVEEPLLRDYLEAVSERHRWKVSRTTLLTQISTHGDRAVAILHLRNEPLTVEDIAQYTGGPSRSLANAIQADPRIRRISRGHYGLAEWGGNEYSGIADWISRRIEESGGAIAFTDLLSDAPALEVSESSIRAYVDSPEFNLEDGMVSRSEDLNVTIEADPEETTDLYFVSDGWRSLQTVDSEHLRGSGRPLARWYGAVLDVPYRGSVELSTDGGLTVSVYLNRLQQVSLGSLKSVLEAAGLEEGDRFWLIVDPKAKTLRVEKAEPRVEGLSGADELRNVVGLPPRDCSPEDTMAEVNQMLGLKADAPRRKTVSRFNHRRQDELAELARYLF